MKMKIALATFAALTLAAVLSAIALNRQPDAKALPAKIQEFVVKGFVRGVDVGGKTIRIEHEEIPDYMPAMTMPFSVKEPKILTSFQSGDAVTFRLMVTGDDSWISSIQKSERAMSSPISPARSKESDSVRETQKLRTGELVPSFTLTDQRGQAVQLSDFKGKAVLLTFIYTRCPLPNFCPLMSKNFASLQERLEKEFPGRFQLLSVSIDPKFDTREVLKEYSAVWSKNETTWTFLTGTTEEIGGVAELFGLFYEGSGGLINHDLRTALIGVDGKLVHVWKSNVWTPYEVQRSVREHLTGKRDLASSNSPTN
jgi:protein SCO1/2